MTSGDGLPVSLTPSPAGSRDSAPEPGPLPGLGCLTGQLLSLPSGTHLFRSSSLLPNLSCSREALHVLQNV